MGVPTQVIIAEGAGVSTPKLKKNEKLVVEQYIVKTDAKGLKPPFAMIGTGERLYPPISHLQGSQSMDALKIVSELDSDSRYTFFLLRDAILPKHYGTRGEVRYDTSSLTKGQSDVFSKGYLKLKAKKLVLRVTKGIYLINPNLLIPRNYEEVLAIWNNAWDVHDAKELVKQQKKQAALAASEVQPCSP
jgi:hypothetical protein